MTNELLTPLRAFVEAYATQNTENADQLIHEYLCKKSQNMLNEGSQHINLTENKFDSADQLRDFLNNKYGRQNVELENQGGSDWLVTIDNNGKTITGTYDEESGEALLGESQSGGDELAQLERWVKWMFTTHSITTPSDRKKYDAAKARIAELKST